jgi:hypothetical protein
MEAYVRPTAIIEPGVDIGPSVLQLSCITMPTEFAGATVWACYFQPLLQMSCKYFLDNEAHGGLSQPASAVGRGLMVRRILFWLHLSTGLLAGIVIFIMSLTGVLLAWQRQIIHFADREFRQPSAISQHTRTSPENLLPKVVETRQSLPQH